LDPPLDFPSTAPPVDDLEQPSQATSEEQEDYLDYPFHEIVTARLLGLASQPVSNQSGLVNEATVIEIIAHGGGEGVDESSFVTRPVATSTRLPEVIPVSSAAATEPAAAEPATATRSSCLACYVMVGVFFAAYMIALGGTLRIVGGIVLLLIAGKVISALVIKESPTGGRSSSNDEYREMGHPRNWERRPRPSDSPMRERRERRDVGVAYSDYLFANEREDGRGGAPPVLTLPAADPLPGSTR
jgi:hypothetical protein